MTCPVCATPTVPGARFCFACGASLGDVPEVETERRVVTVLFGDLSDFTSWAEDLDPERVGVVTDRVLASLATIVGEYGGHVDKLTGDGIMAVFGAPTAHEDDAERAVRAAARMQAVVRRLVEEESGGGQRLGLRVGLNTGEVVAGVQAHLSYTVVGDTVNTASRLSDAAGVGGVYAGRETAVGTMATASWRALQPLRLKGKREPVPAYELVGLRPAGSARLGLGDEAPYLGRDAEIGLLIGRLLDVSDTAVPRAVLLTGEAGVGKTRTAHEIARFTGELPGARVLWGRCAPYGEGRELSAVAEMVRTACGIGEDDDAATARARVARTAARLGHPGVPAAPTSSVAERLLDLLGLSGPAVDGAPDVAGTGTGGDAVREAVAALFSALAADAPLLLVIDDLQWATTTMLEGVLDVAARTTGRVLLVAVGRPEVLEMRVERDGEQHVWWRRLPDCSVLPLLPLEETAAERLLRAYLGSSDGTAALDPGVRDALLTRAQGNPFFLAELLHLLVDQGVLVRDGECWALVGDVPRDLLPAGVQAVLAARIDGLDGAAKGVLRDASVLGLRQDLPGLEAVGRASGHGDPEVVRGAVRTLLERRLLEADPDDAGYRFAHTLVRDVAYAGLAKAERARRHAAAAAHLQAQAHGEEAAAVVAAQAERAVKLATEMGLPSSDPAWKARGLAFDALLRLGRAEQARDDDPAAERLLRRALALSDGLPSARTAPARVALAGALSTQHRVEEAAQVLQPALGAADDAVRAAGLVVLGDIRRKSGDVAGAVQALVTAMAVASAAGASRVAADALRALGLVDYFDGRLRSAEERFGQARQLAEQVGDPRGAGWALQHQAWSATTRGDYALAEDVLDDAAALFRSLDDEGGLAWVAGTTAFVRLLAGRLAEARAIVAEVLPAAEARGERWGVAGLLVIDALAAVELGHADEGAERAARALTCFVDLGDAWGRAMALVAAGSAARRSDEPERAVGLLREAVAVAEAARHRLVEGLALVVLGYACLDAGDVDGADGAAVRALALLGQADLEPSAGLGAQVLHAQALRRRGEQARAVEVFDAALAVSTSPALLFPRRQALAHRAGTLLELGRHEEALASAREAVALESEDAPSRVLALRAYGAALRACGDRDRAVLVLREALEAARWAGQASEVALTERVLAAAGAPG